MATNVQLQAKGLSTFGNNLDLNPGSLLIADNVVIDRPDVIEQRRGMAAYGDEMPSVSDRASQLLIYKNRLLRQYNDVLEFDSNASGTFVAFSGQYNPTETGLRIKGTESNGNFYFTTSEGIKKISATGANQFTSAANFITDAGAPRALDLNAQISTTAQGFLPYNSKTSYRVLWGTRDNNQNLILGVPSPRVEIAYSLTDSIINNINGLLSSLDSSAASAASVALHTQNNYFELYSLNNTEDYNAAVESLTRVVEKLDSDFTITKAVSAASAVVFSTNDLTVVFDNPVSSLLTIGDKLAISGFSTYNSTTANPYWTVNSVSGASATLSITGGAVSSFTLSGAGVSSYNYRGLEAAAPVTGDVVYSDYTDLLNYFNDIVNLLNLAPSSWIEGAYQPISEIAIDAAEVKLQFTVPKEIQVSTASSFFYQVYRTDYVTADTAGITLGDISSGDEMKLVLEDNPTTAQVSAGFVEVLDSTPDEFLGVNLYTNENSGEGIAQANAKPPVAKDIALFKECLFFANTQTNHQKSVTLLGVSNLNTPVTSLNVVSTQATSNVATVVFNSSPSALFAASSLINLSGFSGASDYLNGTFTVQSVSGVSANLSISNTATFGVDSATADFGQISKIESITFTRDVDQETLYFVPAIAETTKVTTLPASSLATTGTASYFNLNSTDNSFYVWYNQGTVSDPAVSGKVGIEINLIGTETAADVAQKSYNAIFAKSDFNTVNTQFSSNILTISDVNEGYVDNASDVSTGFTIYTTKQGSGEKIADGYIALYTSGTPAQNVEDTAKSIIKVLNRRTSDVNISGYYISGLNDLPGKMYFQANDLQNIAFSLTASTVAVGEAFDPTLPTSGDTVSSDNSVLPNGLFFSKQRQPEHVPVVNYFPIGPKDKKILRILPLRDSLFILKEDGIYRISGDNPNNFSSFLFDTSAKLLAPDTAVVLNNQIYMWSDQGVVRVSDTGVDIVSRTIEDQLNKLVYTDNFRTASFGVNYDLDRAYLLWVTNKIGDDYATQCYRYNIFTNAWTRWPIAKTCGIVGSDNKLYLGSAVDNYIERERKALDRTDFCDREIVVQVIDSGVDAEMVFISSLTQAKQYDVLLQNQYLTITQFNSLLKKLDLDPSTSLSNNYFSTLEATAGANLRNKLTDLANKLDTDLGVTTYINLPEVVAMDNLNPVTLQDAFNSITESLNGAANIAFTNYPTLSGIVSYEAVINNINLKRAAVELDLALPLVVGPVSIMKHYTSKVQYSPIHFGNPITLKQVREATYLFFADNFKGATFSYASDLSPGFDSIEYANQENGTFGNYTYGEGYYGGGGQSIPLRVLIPQQKQRCTFLRCQFEHNNAREKYQLYGLSLTVEVNAVDARAYR